jgi:hypothetical protein
VYRIESRLNNVKVYVDGDLVIDHVLTWSGGGSDVLSFGDIALGESNNLSYWDYFWYDVFPSTAVGGIAELPAVAGTGAPGMGGATYAVMAGAAAGVLAFAVLASLSVRRWRVR